MKGLGCFQKMLCALGYFFMYKLMSYLNTYPRTTLIFQKKNHLKTGKLESIGLKINLKILLFRIDKNHFKTQEVPRTSYSALPMVKASRCFLEQPDHRRFIFYLFQSILLNVTWDLSTKS